MIPKDVWQNIVHLQVRFQWMWVAESIILSPNRGGLKLKEYLD